jgi:hypothetical protein
MQTRHDLTSRTGSRAGLFRHGRGERGAVLVHVAISMIGLIAFNGLVIDYGILWLARREAQNSADAAAMAGAVSLGFVDINDQPLARQSAIAMANQNYIWGVTPDIEDTDVTFPPCPPGSPGAGTNACIRVDVFRNQRTSTTPKPIPTIFGTLFGVTLQGVKATATAEVLYGTSVNCVRPWAIPDKWQENLNDVTNPPPSVVGWDQFDSFERYDKSGNLLPGTPDYYQPWGSAPTPTPPGWQVGLEPDGTGYTKQSVTLGGDYGRKFVLKPGNPHDAIAPGWFYPVVAQPCCIGGDCYRDSISGCVCPNDFLAPPMDILKEPGNKIGPTKQGVDALVAQDPDAKWDPSLNGGKGGIYDGCMDPNHASHPCPTTNGYTPRLVPIPVFDPDDYDLGKASGRNTIKITKLVGFFILPMNGNDVEGYLMDYPTVPTAGPPAPAGSTFLISIALVR